MPGEAGGYFVTNSTKELTAYLKPTVVCSPIHPRAAIEKIASDIAYELNLAVPPVLLYRNDNPINDEKRTCLSLQVYPTYFEWEKLLDLSAMDPIIRNIINTSLSNCCGLIALDLYLGQTDRQNGRNVIWGTYSNNKYSGFVFLDFANSMNYNDHWDHDGWKNISPRIPGVMLESVNKEILAETTEKIRNLNEGKIHSIINRIDNDFLSDHHKTIIHEGLLKRRVLIADHIRGNYLR